jgi:hypothetical protein
LETSGNWKCFSIKIILLKMILQFYNVIYVRDKVFPVQKWTLIEPLVIASCFAQLHNCT